MVIDSRPPPITTSRPSLITMLAATATALRPEEQKRLTVPPGTVTGRPPSRATLRPVLNPCGPSGKPQPMITSSISPGSSCGTFFSRSFTQWAARSSGRVMLKEPRNDLARPVRELATTTALLIRALLGAGFPALEATTPQAVATRRLREAGRHRSGGMQLEDGDLARGEETDPLSREAEAAVHVEEGHPLAVEPSGEGGDELREVAGSPPARERAAS